MLPSRASWGMPMNPNWSSAPTRAPTSSRNPLSDTMLADVPRPDTTGAAPPAKPNVASSGTISNEKCRDDASESGTPPWNATPHESDVVDPPAEDEALLFEYPKPAPRSIPTNRVTQYRTPMTGAS